MPPRNYCAVAGCCSSKRFKQVSFFRLPREEEVRKKWLTLIGRPDLAESNINPRSHFVCSLHFDESVMISVPKLKPDAMPSKLLPSLSASGANHIDKSTQTDDLKIDISSAIISSSDASEPSASDSGQAAAVAHSPKPRKRKLRGDSKETELKRRKQPNGLVEVKDEVIFKKPA